MDNERENIFLKGLENSFEKFKQEAEGTVGAERCNSWFKPESGDSTRCVLVSGHGEEHVTADGLRWMDANEIQGYGLHTGQIASGNPTMVHEAITPSGYVEAALRTEPDRAGYFKVYDRLDSLPVLRLLHAGMGLCTEAGEFVDQLKRHLFYGKELDMGNIAEEIGDVFWYSALAISVSGKTAESVMAANIAKLFKRYPDKFYEVSALVRDILQENKAMEEHL